MPEGKLQLPKSGHAQKAKFSLPWSLLSFFSPHFFLTLLSISKLQFGGKYFQKIPEDREIILNKAWDGSRAKSSLKFLGRGYMVFCVSLDCLTESR